MLYFDDNSTVTFKELERSGMYPKYLLEEIKKANYEFLNEELTETERSNKYFMEPLLYAVKNEYGTYKIFEYYSKSLQEDFELVRDIIIEEPELIKGTAISYNRQFILEVADINPRVLIYMSPTLKQDSKFTEELCNLHDKEVIMYAITECKMPDVIIDNPKLARHPEFMKEAIRGDVNFFKYADDSLKNDYKFIRDISKDNKEVINYVVAHTNEFGKEALDGAKDSLEEYVIDNATKKVQDERKKIVDEKKELAIEGNNENNPEEIAKRERDLTSIERAMQKFKTMSPDKKGRYAHLILQATNMEQYQNMDEEFKEELEKYEKLYLATRVKEKSKSKIVHEQTGEENNADIKQEPEKVKDNSKITLEQIEERIEGARISEINGETKGIREEYTRETRKKEEMIEYESVGNETRA